MRLATIPFAIIDRPRRALTEAAQRPRSWWLPALLLIVSMLVLIWVTAPDQVVLANERAAEMIERITANLTEEQAQAVRARTASTTLQSYWIAAAGMGLAMAALGWVLRGGMVHFSSMAAGGKSAWNATFAVGVWTMFPYFFRDLLQSLYVSLSGKVLEHQGLAFLVASGNWLDDSRHLVYALLSNVDPFALWHLVLLSIGIAVATKLSGTKATIMALIVWAVFLGLKLIPVAISASLGSSLLG